MRIWFGEAYHQHQGKVLREPVGVRITRCDQRGHTREQGQRGEEDETHLQTLLPGLAQNGQHADGRWGPGNRQRGVDRRAFRHRVV